MIIAFRSWLRWRLNQRGTFTVRKGLIVAWSKR